MRFFDISLYFASPIVLLGLIIIFVRRRLSPEFPVFFAYLLYVPVTAVLRMSVNYHSPAYFWLYWSTEAGFGIFALLVLREVFHRVFAVAYASYRWFGFLLPATVFIIVGFTLWETIYHPLWPRHIPWIISAIYWFDFGVHLLEGMILLLVLALTIAFPVSWRQYEFGILAGFGLNASVTMMAYLFRFQGGHAYENFFRYGPPVAYFLATLIWLHAFFRPPAPSRHPQMDLEELLAIVRRWKHLLEKIEKAVGLRRRTISQTV